MAPIKGYCKLTKGTRASVCAVDLREIWDFLEDFNSVQLIAVRSQKYAVKPANCRNAVNHCESCRVSSGFYIWWPLLALLVFQPATRPAVHQTAGRAQL